jgi:ketosteroid isomerase-like protein
LADHPNIEVIRSAYAAMGRGDLSVLNDVWSPDLVWHVPKGLPISGVYSGRDEIFGVYGQLAAFTQGSLRVELEDVLANDEHGVAMVRSQATRNGTTYHATELNLLYFEDGKVTSFWSLAREPYPDEFWAGFPAP